MLSGISLQDTSGYHTYVKELHCTTEVSSNQCLKMNTRTHTWVGQLEINVVAYSGKVQW